MAFIDIKRISLYFSNSGDEKNVKYFINTADGETIVFRHLETPSRSLMDVIPSRLQVKTPDKLTEKKQEDDINFYDINFKF